MRQCFISNDKRRTFSSLMVNLLIYISLKHTYITVSEALFFLYSTSLGEDIIFANMILCVSILCIIKTVTQKTNVENTLILMASFQPVESSGECEPTIYV